MIIHLKDVMFQNTSNPKLKQIANTNKVLSIKHAIQQNKQKQKQTQQLPQFNQSQSENKWPSAHALDLINECRHSQNYNTRKPNLQMDEHKSNEKTANIKRKRRKRTKNPMPITKKRSKKKKQKKQALTPIDTQNTSKTPIVAKYRMKIEKPVELALPTATVFRTSVSADTGVDNLSSIRSNRSKMHRTKSDCSALSSSDDDVLFMLSHSREPTLNVPHFIKHQPYSQQKNSYLEGIDLKINAISPLLNIDFGSNVGGSVGGSFGGNEVNSGFSSVPPLDRNTINGSVSSDYYNSCMSDNSMYSGGSGNNIRNSYNFYNNTSHYYSSSNYGVPLCSTSPRTTFNANTVKRKKKENRNMNTLEKGLMPIPIFIV